MSSSNHRPVRDNVVRAGTVIIASAVLVTSAFAQTSTSQAQVNAGGSGNACNGFINGPSASSSASCVPSSAYETGFAASASNNVLRTANGLGTVGTSQYAPYDAQGTSTQNSSVSFSGIPAGSPTGLRFRFNTISTGTTAASITSNSLDQFSFSSWTLLLSGTQNSAMTTASAADTVYARDAVQRFKLVNGVQTATGYDFTLPFDPTGGVFSFAVTPTGFASGFSATAGSGSIFETLMGIDAVNAGGQSVALATFSGTDGTAKIDFAPTVTPPSTVPEPSSMALLGTGLIGLVPMLRRKNR